ncbi:MAG: NUDIX hydrolase [Paracoccaceae bacterium]
MRVLVTRERGVLLLTRPHPPVWEMPGGAINPGESPAEAVGRETREETGREVRLAGLVGTCRRCGWLGGTVHLYRATPSGGHLATNEEESHRVEYLAAERDLRLMLPRHARTGSARATPTDAATVQRVGTRDVLIMVGLTLGYHRGLLRDPLEHERTCARDLEGGHAASEGVRPRRVRWRPSWGTLGRVGRLDAWVFGRQRRQRRLLFVRVALVREIRVIRSKRATASIGSPARTATSRSLSACSCALAVEPNR